MLPANESEKRLLAELPMMAPSSLQRIGEQAVIVDAPYTAASGRTCRTVHVTQGVRRESTRLACSDGTRWFFVPEVFVGGITRD